ncbi:MAG: hypothetical protein E6R05_05370 [Candidatus Moraniibacteriota bacterium]|nr:MAG: hypothetical protein E6R05_05370 [Candidatus Moranbacteria bacterium]
MQKYLLLTLTLILPLIFWTLTPNFFVPPKLLIMFTVLIGILASILYQVLVHKTIKQSSSSLRIPLFLLLLTLLSALAIHPNTLIDALLGPTGLYLCFIAICYLIPTLSHTNFSNQLLNIIFIGTGIVALQTLFQLTIAPHLNFIPSFLQQRSFFVTGSALASLSLLIPTLSGSLYLAFTSPTKKTLHLFLSTLYIIAIVALISLMLPGQSLSTPILPLRASWNLALDAMKSPQSLIFGIGPTEFGNFYNSVKPLYLNNTTLWNYLPENSGTEILNILTTLGILGLSSMLLIIFTTLTSTAHTLEQRAFKVMFSFAALLLFIFPGTIPLLYLFFLMAGSLATAQSTQSTLTSTTAYLLTAISVIVFAFLGYQLSRVILAENHLRLAQLALQQSDGKTVYDHHLRAVTLFPKSWSYRLAYSQVNLTLASALSQKNSALTDNDRQNVAQLISQAIREAKASVSLNPNNYLTWQNLGNIYGKIVSIAKGADQFAIDNYTQALTRNAGSATLRLEFGNLLTDIAKKDQEPKDQAALYQRAREQYQTAIQLKNDFLLAYLKLGELLKLEKDYANATLVLEKALTLAAPESTDYTNISSELNSLKANPTPTPAPTDPPTTTINSDPIELTP